ncbi:uncharacterized protein LOC135483234 [Lineus longissimus]|uniref:uncharacterized protein LOC135483234 n=1 Tax=Lineus longissimus TaxID=88925 RepID=UPI002B4F491B
MITVNEILVIPLSAKISTNRCDMGSGASSSRASSPSAPSEIKVKPPPDREPAVKPTMTMAASKSQQEIGPQDIMISYSHSDKKMMEKIRDALEENGISVWVDMVGLKAGVDFLSKIGQAIIDAKVFLSLVTEYSVQSKYCRDELALAYVSQKPIFPVGFKSKDFLFPLMDVGMRLQLSRFDWYSVDKDKFETDFANVIEDIQTEITNVKNKEAREEAKEEKEEAEQERPKLERSQTRPQMRVRTSRNSKQNQRKNDFWDKHFAKKETVDWNSMKQVFTKEFDNNLKSLFTSNEDKQWLESILKRELSVKGQMTRRRYDEFCMRDNGELEPFWSRVEDYAVESYAIKKVFEMESSVRVEAISNLEKYKSPAVVEALMDLLDDDDFNVCAVAAITLSKMHCKSNITRLRIVDRIINILNSSDRLVRETGCLALGRLKATKAVPKLVTLWRNDVISTVREAAGIALKEIGGEEADKAIHMTKVLTEEIRILTLS